jgi:hypothetical protein
MNRIKATETVRTTGPDRLVQTGRVYSVGPEGDLTARQAERLIEAGYAEACSNAEPAYTVQKGDGGWWKVIGPDEEAVDGESERSEEAAQANADALNSNA